eukprot:gene1013-1151_t
MSEYNRGVTGYNLPILLLQKIIRYAWLLEGYGIYSSFRWKLSLDLVCKQIFHYVSSVLFTNISFMGQYLENGLFWPEVYHSLTSAYSPLKHIYTFAMDDETYSLFLKIRRVSGQWPLFLSEITTLTVVCEQEGDPVDFTFLYSMPNLHTLMFNVETGRNSHIERFTSLLEWLDQQTSLTRLNTWSDWLNENFLNSRLERLPSITEVGLENSGFSIRVPSTVHTLTLHVWEDGYGTEFKEMAIHSQHIRHLKLKIDLYEDFDISDIALMASLDTLTIITDNACSPSSDCLSILLSQALKSQTLKSIIFHYRNGHPSELLGYEATIQFGRQHNLYRWLRKLDEYPQATRNRICKATVPESLLPLLYDKLASESTKAEPDIYITTDIEARYFIEHLYRPSWSGQSRGITIDFEHLEQTYAIKHLLKSPHYDHIDIYFGEDSHGMCYDLDPRWPINMTLADNIKSLLIFAEVPIFADHINIATLQSQYLTKLDLSLSFDDDEQLKEVTDILASRLPNLLHFGLEVLDLNNEESLSSQACNDLFQAIGRHPMLQSLELESNLLLDGNFKLFIEALKHSKTIQKLSIEMDQDLSSKFKNVLNSADPVIFHHNRYIRYF